MQSDSRYLTILELYRQRGHTTKKLAFFIFGLILKNLINFKILCYVVSTPFFVSIMNCKSQCSSVSKLILWDTCSNCSGFNHYGRIILHSEKLFIRYVFVRPTKKNCLALWLFVVSFGVPQYLRNVLFFPFCD